MCQGTFPRRARVACDNPHPRASAHHWHVLRNFLLHKKSREKLSRQFSLKSSSKYSGNGAENSIYLPPSADARTLKSLRAASAPEAYTGISPDHKRHHPRADVQCLHMDADLVRSTRLQAALDMGEILKPCEHLVMGHCGFPLL